MNNLENYNPVEFIVQLCDKHHITAYEIEKETGLNASGVQRILNKEVKKPRTKTLKKIIEYIEKRITATQLYNKQKSSTLLQEPNSKYIPLKTKDRVVPYYNIEISGGYFSSFSEAKEYIEFYIDYKPLNDCTAYLPYFGNSMNPMFISGNTLAVKQIHNFDIILWGEPHLVITNENANSYKTVKCLHKHKEDDKVILRALNPDYPGDIIINKKDILSLFIVKGKIELNEL